MNFSLFALASILATAAAAGPIRRKTIKLDNNQRTLRRGEPSTEALLKVARPYNNNGASSRNRRLEDGELNIDGSYSLKFSQCAELKTKDEDMFEDENMVAYAQSGQIASTASYVLFRICQDNDCYYDTDGDVYMVSLADWLTYISQSHANKRTDYCNACNEFADYCTQDAEEEEDDKDEEEEEEEEEDEEEEEEEEDDRDEEEEEDDRDEEDDKDEEDEDNKDEEEDDKDEEEDDKDEENDKDRRKLITRKLAKEKINCSQCNSYECFVDEEDMVDGYVNQDELDEEISEWIEELAACKESGVQKNDADLFLGAMCSPYGDSVELAVFLNEDCTIYSSTYKFGDIYTPANDNENGLNMTTYAEQFIKSAFSEVTPCMVQEFADPDEGEDENNNEEEEYELNDYCAGVLEADTFVDFNNCQADENNDKEEDNDDEFNWYTYDITEADDAAEVCAVLNEKGGEYTYAYNEETSGTWHKRDKNGAIIMGDESSGFFNTDSLTPGIIAIIVGVSVFVLGGIAFLMRGKMCNKNKNTNADLNEPVYQGGSMM